MGLTVSTGDARAAYLMGGGCTQHNAWGVDASVANGAQTEHVFADREGTPLLRIVRGTSGTTNLVVKNADAEDCFISVAADQTTLSSSASVVV